jgi:hypothetical protein
MRDWRSGDRGTTSASAGGGAAGLAPGKRTLTEDLPHVAAQARPYTPPVPIPPSGAEIDAMEQHHAPAPPKEVGADAAKDPAGKTKDDKVPSDMTGIGATVAVNRFIVAAKDVQANWTSLKSEERADKFGKAANAELTAAGAYEVKPNLEDLGQFAGQFHFSTWILGLGKAPFSAPLVNDAEASEMAATVYHESRHAEQWHRMARLLAGQGKKPAEITTALSIPAKVAVDAAAKPLKDATTTEGKEATSWYESVYGVKSAERNKLFKETRPKYRKLLDDAEAEYKKLLADKTATKNQKDEAAKKYKAAYDTYQKEYYEKYRALPEESDSWAVEDKMKTAYMKKT